MKKAFVFVISLCFSFITFGFILSENSRTQSIQKIIKFSHRIHIKDAGMACADCHASILESQQAEDRNLPEKALCADCHDVEDENGCTLCHLGDGVQTPFPNAARSAFFNHQKHADDAKMPCEKCHIGIENCEVSDGTTIPRREECNTCHNGLDASMNCLECHARETQLRPTDHNQDWSRQHMVQIRSGANECTHCHTNNYCQECHESVDLVSTKILPNDYYANYSPHLNGSGTQVIQTVHDLNFRYTHQVEALGKEKDCQTCHEASIYCAECHSAENGPMGIRPSWHGGADWGAVVMSVGSGGGRHAEMARRDIERCTACHDVQGADPACLMCHTDFDGMKNTDPKTHGVDFTNRFGADADFHHDAGTICFNCHTNTNQSGVGFCSYCHGHERD